MSNFFTAGPVVFTGSSAVQLDGVVDIAADPGTQMLLESAAGDPDPSFSAVQSQSPVITTTVMDCKTALDMLGIGGIKIPDGTTWTGAVQYLRQQAENEYRSSGSNHAKITMNYGMVLPEELSWTQGRYATLKVGMHAGYDGTNNPWVWAASAALPATPLVDEVFTGGPVYINGTIVPVATVQGVTLRWDIRPEKIAGSGEIWPRRLHVETRRIQIEIDTKNALNLSSYGLIGTAVNSSTVKIYLRKYALNQGLVADGTAEHIKITVANVQGHVVPGQIQVGNNKAAGYKLMLTPLVGAAAVIAINTASAVA